MATFGTQAGHRRQGGPHGAHSQGRGQVQGQGQGQNQNKKKLKCLELLETQESAIKKFCHTNYHEKLSASGT